MDKFNHGQQWMIPGSIIVSDKVTKFNHRIINENFKSVSMYLCYLVCALHHVINFNNQSNLCTGDIQINLKNRKMSEKFNKKAFHYYFFFVENA